MQAIPEELRCETVQNGTKTDEEYGTSTELFCSFIL